MIDNEMLYFFQSEGFTHHSYETYKSVVYSDINGCYVELSKNKLEFTLKAVDGLVKSELGPCGFPNKNAYIFLRMIRRHAEVG